MILDLEEEMRHPKRRITDHIWIGNGGLGRDIVSDRADDASIDRAPEARGNATVLLEMTGRGRASFERCGDRVVMQGHVGLRADARG